MTPDQRDLLDDCVAIPVFDICTTYAKGQAVKLGDDVWVLDRLGADEGFAIGIFPDEVSPWIKLVAIHDCKPMCGEAFIDTGSPFNRCTECQWGDDAPVCGCGPHTMTAKDNDGEFCIRCGHAPGCHKRSCIVCNGTRVIPSVGDCPECAK